MKTVSAVVLILGLGLTTGCSPPPVTSGPTLALEAHSTEVVMVAACTVLEHMHFTIGKADPDRGLIRTTPLSGAQWFELWRQDNVGRENTLEANLQSLRRTVEIQLIPADQPERLECHVLAERLSFPTQPIVSSAQAYRMLAASTSSIQRLELHEDQNQEMAWLDLGDDKQLAGAICDRIQARLNQAAP